MVGQPEHGTLNGQGISFSYTPDSSYTGSDSSSFRANDGQVDSNLATISIDILASNNVAPQSENKGYSIFGPELLDIHLQAIDPNNDKLTYSIVEQPKHGILTGDAPALVYLPEEGFEGTDNFSFKTNDGQEDSNLAEISIDVFAGSEADIMTTRPGRSQRSGGPPSMLIFVA